MVLLISLVIPLGNAQNSLPSEFGIKEIQKIDIRISSDGSAKVKEQLVLNQTTARILIPKYLQDLSLTDSQGNDLGYELDEHQEGQILSIYLKSPQEKSITISYNTQTLTVKNLSQWTFKFSSLATSRVTIVKIDFPTEANITSLRIKETLFHPFPLVSPLFLYPQSNKLYLETDYELLRSELPQTDFIYLILLFFLFLIFLAIFFYLKKRKVVKVEEKSEALEPEKEINKVNPSVLKMLDEQEKEIIKMLESSPEEEITQAYIYKTLGIPKSSLSEIIRRLEQRDLIEKKKEGRINWIKLKKWVFK